MDFIGIKTQINSIRLNKVILILSILLSVSFAKAAEVVVLIPGFFNSFTPEYFSQDIVQSFTQKGFKVYVARGLNPIGTIEENGSIVENIFQQIETHEGHRVRFNVVAHSAGGFYTLWVANRQKFFINNLYTISTPYKGVEFVQRWIDDCLVFKGLSELAYLDGLRQLTESGVQRFLQSIRIHPQMKITAFGGSQAEGFDITDARNISVPLRITGHYISATHDGIVGLSSALGIGSLLTTENKRAQQYIVSNVKINLEHWEQVLDSHAFIFLGVRNTGYIANEQRRFYSGLADLLLKAQKP